jgi:hypothetical protein
MSTVYITQEVLGRNILPATKYGKAVVIFPSSAQVVLSSTPTIRKLRHMLREFNNEDYLLLSGDPIIMGLAMMVAADYNRGEMVLLKWDRQEKQYYPVEVDFYDKTGGTGYG